MEAERKKAGRPSGSRNIVRTPKQKEELILEFSESGLGYKQFAESKGISHSLFYSWLEKYSSGGIEALYPKNKRIVSDNFLKSTDSDRIKELEQSVYELELLTKGLISEIIELKKHIGLPGQINLVTFLDDMKKDME